ncbi:MAG: hypothetical protein WC755_00215 [Candidatus Woesearchaeota archaeon]|jgi:uncharacterized membrane protein
MNQKNIGIIIIIVGLLLSLFVYAVKLKEDKYIEEYTKKNNTCYLDDGTCLHSDRSYTLYIFGFVISMSLIVLGVYLVFFDKVQRKILENQDEISHRLKEVKELENKKDEFSAFVSAFSEDEQNILKAIHAQEGIKQSTIRFKTGLSKTTVSLILSSLEKRKIVSRKVSGKTNEVYLIKKF